MNYDELWQHGDSFCGLGYVGISSFILTRLTAVWVLNFHGSEDVDVSFLGCKATWICK
jgi:hypothetical protein